MIKFKKQKFSNIRQLQLIKNNVHFKNKCNKLQESYNQKSKRGSYVSSLNSIQKSSVDLQDDVPLFPEFHQKENHSYSQYQFFHQQKQEIKQLNKSMSIIEQDNHDNNVSKIKNAKIKTEIIFNNPPKAKNILQILLKKDVQDEKKENRNLYNNQNKNKNACQQKLDRLKPKLIIINKSVSLKANKQITSNDKSKVSIKKEYVRSERIKTQPSNIKSDRKDRKNINKRQKSELKSKIDQIIIDQQAIYKQLCAKVCDSDKDTLQCTFQPIHFRRFMQEITQNKCQPQQQIKIKNALNVAIRNEEWLKRKDEKINKMRRQEQEQRLKKQEFSHRPQIHEFKGQKSNVKMSKFGQEGVQKYFNRLSNLKKKNSVITFKRQQKIHPQSSILKQSKHILNKNSNDKQSKRQLKTSYNAYNAAVKNLNDRILKMNL